MFDTTPRPPFRPVCPTEPELAEWYSLAWHEMEIIMYVHSPRPFSNQWLEGPMEETRWAVEKVKEQAMQLLRRGIRGSTRLEDFRAG